jgi:hypothetical protein
MSIIHTNLYNQYKNRCPKCYKTGGKDTLEEYKEYLNDTFRWIL